MTTTAILTIVFGILSVVAIFISYYFNIKTKIREAAAEAINTAEELKTIGAEKLIAAVNQVYTLVPMALKPFLTKEVITQII